jgi:hypothetical protein
MRFAPVLLMIVAARSALGVEGVILLLGLARTDRSMVKMASVMGRDGYVVLNSSPAPMMVKSPSHGPRWLE